MSRIFAYTMLIALALAFLWHFVCLWLWGEILVSEPNRAILIGETALMGGILGLGFYCLKKDTGIRTGSMKDKPCPYKPITCQEGYCHGCQIYLHWQKAKGTARSGYDTENKGFRVQQ